MQYLIRVIVLNGSNGSHSFYQVEKERSSELKLELFSLLGEMPEGQRGVKKEKIPQPSEQLSKVLAIIGVQGA